MVVGGDPVIYFRFVFPAQLFPALWSAARGASTVANGKLRAS